MIKIKPIFAICGKGGVGKTVFSALFARALKTAGVKPLLLIDADPAGGLVSAIGERVENTLAGVREKLIASARQADEDVVDPAIGRCHRAARSRPWEGRTRSRPLGR